MIGMVNKFIPSCFYPNILVAIGPLFIVATLFDATRRFFENWAGMLCNYALILVLVVGVNLFIVGIFNTYLAQPSRTMG